MAVVIDEYSRVSGIATFEDVLEQIVGDIVDEHDDEEDSSGNISPQSDNRYIVQAVTPVEEFNTVIGTQFSDEEFDTIAGIVINELGKIPRQGEELVLAGWLFRVLRSDSRRILLLEVLPYIENSHPEQIAAL